MPFSFGVRGLPDGLRLYGRVVRRRLPALIPALAALPTASSSSAYLRAGPRSARSAFPRTVCVCTKSSFRVCGGRASRRDRPVERPG